MRFMDAFAVRTSAIEDLAVDSDKVRGAMSCLQLRLDSRIRGLTSQATSLRNFLSPPLLKIMGKFFYVLTCRAVPDDSLFNALLGIIPPFCSQTSLFFYIPGYTAMNHKKRLLLINPPPNLNSGSLLHLENLGLAYLAASVRKHLGDSHEVYLWDCALIDPKLLHFRELLDATRPDYVGFSLTAMNADQGKALALTVKEHRPGTKVIIGGILASSLPVEELSCFRPDAIIRGEGERTLPDVLGVLDAQASPSLIELSQVQALDVDSLSWAARDMLPWQLHLHPQASISASRGCPFHCSFCSIPQPGSTRRWRPRDIEDVVEEMAYINREFDACHFFFVDDNFLLQTTEAFERTEQFAELVMKKLPPVRFGFMCRSAAVDETLFKILKRAGLSGVFLGIESFSQAVLDRYEKQETVNEHLLAMSTLNRLGITTNPGFIFFDPWTNEREINENLSVMTAFSIPSLQSVNSKLTCYRGSKIEKRIPPCSQKDEEERTGIKQYAFQHLEARELFKHSCTLFYQTLPTFPDYVIYQRHNYCVAYIQPYLLNTDRESLFLSYYDTCQSHWKQGDDVIIELLQNFVGGHSEDVRTLKEVVATRAVPHWREGNAMAERYFRLARIVLLRQVAEAEPGKAKLASFAFTSPFSGLGIDTLFEEAEGNRSINPLVLAKILSFYTGENAAEYFSRLMRCDDEAVAVATIRSALLCFYAPILDAAQEHLARRSEPIGEAFSGIFQRAETLFGLNYVRYILSFSQPGLSPSPGGRT